MMNTEMVTNHLSELGLYPIETGEKYGLDLFMHNEYLMFCGSADDLIEFADLLVSLALSGENRGQHWHVDTSTMVSKESKISSLVLMRNGKVT